MTTSKPRRAWKEKVYPVPNASRRGFVWKASALRSLYRWTRVPETTQPPMVVVPALYNRLPAEAVAMGWLNEIDALRTIRQRMVAASKLTGWDSFTFHTLHNADRFYDSTIDAVHHTWATEKTLSIPAANEAKRRFGKVYDYHQIQPRLVENLVFQSSLMDWTANRAEDIPFRFQIVGTALYSALVWSGALSFDAAVASILRVGERWNKTIRAQATARSRESSQDAIGWQQFDIVQQIIDGKNAVDTASVGISRADLPSVDAPAQPFWFTPGHDEEPVLIQTAREAELALEALNLTSWGWNGTRPVDHSIRGWLVSPLHASARSCRWSVSNYLLATPASVPMFMDHIAGIVRPPVALDAEAQKRLRLSRIKVTGP